MLIINDTLGTYGGSLTLILRICTRLVQKSVKTAVISESLGNTEIVDKLKGMGVEIYNFDVSDKKKTAKFLKSVCEKEKITVVTFIWNKYLDIEAAKKKAGLSFTNIIYCIHPATFYKGKSFPLKFMRKKIVADYKKLLIKMADNGSVYFMDEDTVNATQNYFRFTFPVRPPILPLPMICNALSAEQKEALISEGYNGGVIFTASRAEFPYKGYLFGLIDDFAELKETYRGLKLYMVAGGEEKDVAELQAKLNPVRQKYPGDVIFKNWMDYGALLGEIKKAKLFVGMGTGVLDAALLYKPAIAVKHDSFENLSDCFFHDAPTQLCSDSNERAIKLIKQIEDTSYEEYAELCNKSFAAARNVYDIDKFISVIVTAENKNGNCILSVGRRFKHKLNSWLNRLRNKNNFSYDAIRKE